MKGLWAVGGWRRLDEDMRQMWPWKDVWCVARDGSVDGVSARVSDRVEVRLFMQFYFYWRLCGYQGAEVESPCGDMSECFVVLCRRYHERL